MDRLVLLACLLVLCSGAVVPDKKEILSNILKKQGRGGKIIGGTKTDIEEVPWLVAFEVANYTVCQAVIINEKWAATAGHCMQMIPDQEITLRSASSVVQTGGTTHRVIRNITHEKFDGDTPDYDVTVLEVEEPFEWGPSTQPINLTSTEPAGDDKVFVAGWGALDEHDQELPYDLYSVNITVIDRSECQDVWSFFFDISERLFCTLEVGKGPCDFDAGSPLVKNGTLVGINLYGLNCGEEGVPGIHIDIANQEMHDFITKNTKITK